MSPDPAPRTPPTIPALLAALLSALVLLTPSACKRRAPAEDESGPPARVASRTVLADELLWALGEPVRDRVVGLSPMADDPRYSTVASSWPDRFPRLGRNPEELLALGPDLVIVASFSDPEYRAALEGRVEVLVLDDFTGFSGYLENLEKVGSAVGAVEQARELRTQFEARREQLEAKRPAEDRRPSVVAWDYGYVPGAHTSFDDAASTAGFRNLAAQKGLDGHQRLDAEQLVAWSPDWIVVGCGDRPCAEAITKLEESPGLRMMPAVREGRVIPVEAPYLATTGAGMLELAARMQAALEKQPGGDG